MARRKITKYEKETFRMLEAFETAANVLYNEEDRGVSLEALDEARREHTKAKAAITVRIHDLHSQRRRALKIKD